MNDREKLELIFRLFQVPTDTKGKSILAAERKFLFDDAGEITRIIDYQHSLRSTPDKSERLHKYVSKGRLIVHANSQFIAAGEGRL